MERSPNNAETLRNPPRINKTTPMTIENSSIEEISVEEIKTHHHLMAKHEPEQAEKIVTPDDRVRIYSKYEDEKLNIERPIPVSSKQKNNSKAAIPDQVIVKYDETEIHTSV